MLFKEADLKRIEELEKKVRVLEGIMKYIEMNTRNEEDFKLQVINRILKSVLANASS